MFPSQEGVGHAKNLIMKQPPLGQQLKSTIAVERSHMAMHVIHSYNVQTAQVLTTQPHRILLSLYSKME